MKTRIHVNQHVIKKNTKEGTRDPVITVKHGKTNSYTNCARILDRNGDIVAQVIYSPDKPLSCGATVWVELLHPDCKVQFQEV